ncbi:hypothetical protein E2320_010395 [Naja naja]|nr:hypothetical protein E2320_010395 [Naja naja]
MGLDRKPTPPKKKTLEESAKLEDWKKEEVTHKLKEEKKVLPTHFPSASALKKRAAEPYEEDFEAEEEKPVEKVEKKARADDQMSEKGKPVSEGETDRSDRERKKNVSSLKSSRASESERDESEGYTESYTEEEERKRGRKKVLSISGSSTLYSSGTESEFEGRKRDEEEDITDVHSEYETETTKSQREGSQGTDVEEEENLGETETESLSTKNVPDIFYEEKVEMTLQDISPGHEKPKLIGLVDMGEEEEKDKLVHLKSSALEGYPSRKISEDKEGDRKSVREKIAEAIEKDQLLSSEPEPSDYSTEDEEEQIAAAQEELLARQRPSLRGEEALKPELVAGKREWGKESIESELASLEKEITPKDGKIESMAKAEEMAIEHRAADRERFLGGFRSEKEEPEDTQISEELRAAKREEPVRWQIAEGKEDVEVTEAPKALKTRELEGIKAVDRDMLEAKEKMKGEYETAKDWEATFAEKIRMERKAGIMEKERKDEAFLREDEEGKYELRPISPMETGLRPPQLKMKHEDETAAAAEKAITGGREVPSEMAETVQDISSRWDEDLYQEYPDVTGMKAISTEDLTLKKIKPLVGEAFLDHEIEITDEDKLAGKPYSEREKDRQARAKDILAIEQTAQGEKAIVQPVERGVEERGKEERRKSKMAAPEEKLDLEKEGLYIEPGLESMAGLMEELAEKEKAKGKMWVEEAEGEIKGLSPRQKMIEEEQKALRRKTEIEEGGTEMALGGEAEIDETGVKTKGKVEKGEVGKKMEYPWEAEGDMALKKEAEPGEDKVDVGHEGQLEVTEAEADMTLKGEAERRHTQATLLPKDRLDAEEAKADITLKGEEETGLFKAKVGPKGGLYPEEAEAEMILEREAEPGLVKAKVGPKGELYAEEEEAEMARKREAEPGLFKAKVGPKGELYAEEEEAEMTLEREAEPGLVKAKVGPKGELYAEEEEAEMTLEREAEPGLFKAKVGPKGELYAEEEEAEMALKREAEPGLVKTKVGPKGELYAEEEEAEMTLEREEIDFSKLRELYAEEEEAEMTLEREAEPGLFKAKVGPKGELYAEEEEAEMALKREAEPGLFKAKVGPKGELYPEEEEAEMALEREESLDFQS